jgi:hypothetical protein
MLPQEALENLNKARCVFHGTAADHMALAESVKVLQEIISAMPQPEPQPEEIKQEEPAV